MGTQESILSSHSLAIDCAHWTAGTATDVAELGGMTAPGDETVNRKRPKQPIYKIQALERAIAVLQVLGASSGPLLLTEVSARTGLHKSTAKRFLEILLSRGMVYRRLNGSYCLGLRLCTYGERAISQFDPSDRAAAPLRRLVGEVGEAGYLCVLRKGMVVFSERATPPHVQNSIPAGAMFPMKGSAAGRAILTPPSNKLLRRGREQRCVVDRDETRLGMTVVAVPIAIKEVGVVASICVAGPSFRLNDERINTITNRLIWYSTRIAAEWSATSPDADI